MVVCWGYRDIVCSLDAPFGLIGSLAGLKGDNILEIHMLDALVLDLDEHNPA